MASTPGPTDPNGCKVSVYMNDGRVFEYYTKDVPSGREHAATVVARGYCHPKGEHLEWYPPHRILKVRVDGGCDSTLYRDTIRAT